MDDAEEEALFARLRRGLELVRRDASLAQSDGAVVPAGPDPETIAALARVEASLRTLASNVESLARRADGVDAAIEARVEATVARTTAGLRAEIERLSSAIAALAARAEAARPEPANAMPPGRPGLNRAAPMPPSRRRPGIGRALLTVLVALVLIALGVTAATRLGYGPDKLPLGQNLQERFSAWRSAWLPQLAAPSSGHVQSAAPLAAADPALKPSTTTADAATARAATPAATAAPAPPAAAPNAAASTTPSVATPPATVAAAPTPSPPPAPAPSVVAALPAPAAQIAPPSPPPVPVATPAPDATPADTAQAAAPTVPPAPTPVPEITLRAKAPVWVEVRERKGRILLRRTLQAGETWSAPSDSNSDLLLSAGNVHNLELTVNGAPQPLPASKGSVLRDARIAGT